MYSSAIVTGSRIAITLGSDRSFRIAGNLLVERSVPAYRRRDGNLAGRVSKRPNGTEILSANETEGFYAR